MPSWRILRDRRDRVSFTEMSHRDFQALARPYIVRDGRRFHLKDFDPRGPGRHRADDGAKKFLKKSVQALSELQEKLYAQDRWGVLLVFQAMDAAGKDSMIKHVLSGINPQGCEVYSFKHPSAEELDHDFLWRSIRRLPERGRIGIFNRSYYEEVLIVRVHPEIRAAENLPDELSSRKNIWRDRLRSMIGLEEHLHRNGTCVLKFFLHISKEEQRKRFLERIDNPEKNWKFNQADIAERKLWKQYMSAYEQCLRETSSKNAPWFIVPADDKKNARLIVAQAVLNLLEELKMSYPETSEERHQELLKIRKELVKK
jgi:PPK2 family polyphosphate:nucleotide phosphotransferase